MADRSDRALTMLYFGGMWQILELWAIFIFKCGLMWRLSRILEDSSAEGNVNPGDLD